MDPSPIRQPQTGEPGTIIKWNPLPNKPGPTTLAGEAFEHYYQAKRKQLTMDTAEQRYSRRVVDRQRKCEGRISMLSEFKAYVSEHRNWIFTILIVAVVDAFFLGGALKQRITALLGGSLKVLERKVNADLDGDGKVGPNKATE